MAEAAMDFADDSLDVGGDFRNSGEQTSEEEEAQATLLVFYPNRQAVPYKLHLGANVIGRQSTMAQRDANRLHQWASEYTDTPVHGIFLESTSISSSHAVIYVEAWGDSCFVKDLGSRNKTFVKRGGKHSAISPHAKHPLQNQDTLTFGALRCRVSFGTSAGSEGSPLASGASPPGHRVTPQTANPYQSSAMSIGQRTIPTPSIPGAPGSLDKCPSLQEWFQHPRRMGSAGRSEVVPLSMGRRRSEEGSLEGEFPTKISFGFGTTIHEGIEPGGEFTSDPEPETPRIDRPTTFTSPSRKSVQNPSPFAHTPLERMDEDDDEPQEERGFPTDTVRADQSMTDQPMDSGEGRSSIELGAEVLTQLRTTPVKGVLAGELAAMQGEGPASQPGTPGTDDLSSERFLERPQSSPLRNHNPPSPFSAEVPSPVGSPTAVGMLGEGDLNLRQGRPIRLQQKSPTPKRSRSGRIASPEKSQPRSKSPRLQRGFEVPNSKKEGFVTERGAGDQHMQLDTIRDAVHDIWSDL